VARLWALLRRWLRDERGSEVVEFALVIPLVVGIVWTSFELWQLMSLRAAVRTTTAQAARFITAYAAPPDGIADTISGDEACWRLQELVETSLRYQRGNMGDALGYDIHFYKIDDPNNAQWDGNVTEVNCGTLFNPLDPNGLQCNDQFGIKLNVSVPWLSVVFGLTGSSAQRTSITFGDTAVGAAPCMPYGDVTSEVWGTSCGPGGGRVAIHWQVEASFQPDLIEIYRGSPETTAPIYTLTNPYGTEGTAHDVIVPTGTSTLTIIAYGGDREMRSSVVVTCP
jgi:Flp pilus assembly pilin Flp